MIFLCYPKCTTCQKAKKWLEQNHILFEIRNIKENNPTFTELKEWYNKSQIPLKRFFNTSGLMYKSLQLKDKIATMTEEEQLTVLATNGMLVKRPIIVNDNIVLVGFKKEEWAEILL